MAEKIRVEVLKQKVFHDGLSMIVLKPGREKVDAAHLQTLFNEGVIANPGTDALRRAAAASGFSDAGETKGVGDDTFSQPIGAFTDAQERNLAEQSQALASDDLDELRDRILVLEAENGEVVKLRARIVELESLNGELDPLRARVLELETERDELITELNELEEKLSKLDPDGDGNPGGSLPQEPPVLAGKNKAELLAIANAEAVDIPDGTTNSEIVKLIEAARAKGDESDAPPA